MFIIKQMMLFIYYFFTILMILIGVVFVTLFERKVLGLIQFRLGPNQIGFKGVIQSLGDALKLMSKFNFLVFFSSVVEYNFLPLGMLFLMITLWLVVPSVLYDYSNSLLMIICILSVGVYPIMYGSWFSGSLYSMLGSIRSIAQMISYEVSMIIIVISLVFIPKSFNLISFFEGGFIMMIMSSMLLVGMLLFSFLVELGRTPVDLLEGESELVSGFNTEYFGLKFALVFLSEYGNIMFMGGLISCLSMGCSFFSLMWVLWSFMYVVIILWIRGVMPRIRYDKLMFLCWVSMLSLSLGFLMMITGLILMV